MGTSRLYVQPSELVRDIRVAIVVYFNWITVDPGAIIIGDSDHRHDEQRSAGRPSPTGPAVRSATAATTAAETTTQDQPKTDGTCHKLSIRPSSKHDAQYPRIYEMDTRGEAKVSEGFGQHGVLLGSRNCSGWVDCEAKRGGKTTEPRRGERL